MEKEDKKIESKVLKVYNEKDSRGGKVRLQVVQWGKYSPTLEKREYYADADGKEKFGKAKGFNSDDFSIILDNADEIEKLLEKSEK